jgi:hypothetical protein
MIDPFLVASFRLEAEKTASEKRIGQMIHSGQIKKGPIESSRTAKMYADAGLDDGDAAEHWMHHTGQLQSRRYEKTAAMPPIPVITGGIGAAVGGTKALKYVSEEHTHDQFLNDMGLMDDAVWKKRKARRRNLVLGATVAGGTLGAATPYALRYGGRKAKEKILGVTPQAKVMAEQAVGAGAQAAGEVASTAGQRFTEGAIKAFTENASSLWDAVTPMKAQATEMAEDIAQTAGRAGAQAASEYMFENRGIIKDEAADLADQAVERGIHRAAHEASRPVRAVRDAAMHEPEMQPGFLKGRSIFNLLRRARP